MKKVKKIVKKKKKKSGFFDTCNDCDNGIVD